MTELNDKGQAGRSTTRPTGDDGGRTTGSSSTGITHEDAADRTSGGPSHLLGRVRLSAYSGIFIFALIVIVFSIWVPETFLTAANWKTIAETSAITAILALGLLLPLSAGVYDLSAAQTLGFSSIVCGWLMTQGPKLPFVVAILVTIACGFLIGLFNAFLVAIIGLDSFIATLGTTSLLLAGAQLITNGEYIGPFSSEFSSISAGSVGGIPKVAIYVLVVALIVWYFLEHTPVGRRVYATGANLDAARLAGIRTRKLIFWSMVVSAVVASIAGILLAAIIGTTNQNLGPSYLLPAFAGAFLGATQLKPGTFNVWGTILAVYLLGTGVQGLQLAGGSLWITDLFNGAALIIAVSIAHISQGFRESGVRRLMRRFHRTG